MRIRIIASELTERQRYRLDEILPADLQEPNTRGSRACVEIELGELNVRHAEMSIRSFLELVTELERYDSTSVLASAVLSLQDLPRVLNRTRNDADPVRRNCAFCHRERTAADDNHGDDCPYWSVGPGSIRPLP